MKKTKDFKYYHAQLEEIKKKMSPSDFRFYNIAHLPILIKNTLEKSESCNTCKANLDNINEIIELIPLESSPSDKRKLFESKKDNLEHHLKTKHKMKLPGYYTSLGSLFGILISGMLGTIITLVKKTGQLNDIIIIALALGLIIGRGLGVLLDKNIFRKNLQL